MEANETLKWHTLSIDETASKLDVDLQKGLSAADAAERLARVGPNALSEQARPSFLSRLWDQLNQFLVLILIVSAIVSAVIGWSQFNKTGEMTEFIDAAAIMAIVVLNAILGLVQEGRAEQALAALKEMAAPNAVVIRGGRQLCACRRASRGEHQSPHRGGVTDRRVGASGKTRLPDGGRGCRPGGPPELRVYEHHRHLRTRTGDRGCHWDENRDRQDR